MQTIQIAGRAVGPGEPTYVIAEMSANHGQDFDRAVRIVREAKAAGADAIKLQTYTPDSMTLDCDCDRFTIGQGTIWEGRRLHELYREAQTPWEWQPRLMAVANDLGLDCFSTPFDRSAVDFLEEMEVPAYKIASFELIDTALVECVASTGKPVILSTGMASLGEIDEAVTALRGAGARQIALLHCTSAYPAPADAMNLRTIPHLADAFDVPVGLSDHTLGIAVPVAAVALGACIVEKHFALSRSGAGPDGPFSLEPDELRAMTEAVRTADAALGCVRYGTTGQEAGTRVFRRSLFVVRDVPAGQLLNDQNVRSIRPGDGLPPKYLPEVLGRRAREDIARGTPLAWQHLS